MVALISSASAMPRLVIGPVTGYLTDRFGRSPVVVLGALLHIAALTGEFFVQEYWQFLLFEVVAGTGIAVYMTSANVLMADATRTGTRGRAVAARQVSNRIGNFAGPVVAGLVAGLFGLRYVFLFIAFTKFMVIIVTLLFIKDTQWSAAPKPVKPVDGNASRMPDLSMFKNRAFVSL